MTQRYYANKGLGCAMANCKRDAYCGGLCSACYAYMRYWLDRSPGDIVNRMQQIELWQTRLDSYLPAVSTVNKRRKKRRKAA